MSITLLVFFLIDIFLKLHLLGGVSYLGLIITITLIWYFGIKFYFEKKKFQVEKELTYYFNMGDNSLLLNENKYQILQYYNSQDYFLFVHTGGYLSVSKNKVDKKALEFYPMLLEKERTWKDTIFWSILGIIIYSSFNYFFC